MKWSDGHEWGVIMDLEGSGPFLFAATVPAFTSERLQKPR
jgi:hypothetical protein